MKNKLLIYAVGGMGNRFNSIINGLYFNNTYFKGDVIIYWPNQGQCNTKWTDLFEIPPNISVINTLDNLDDTFSIFGKYSSTRPEVAPVVNSFGSLLNGNQQYPTNIATVTDTVDGSISNEDRSTILKSFTPTKYIIDEVNKFSTDNNINKNTLGLHIRRTDGHFLSPGGDDYFIDIINRTWTGKNSNIFICSDCNETENKLKSLFPNKIVFRSKLSYTEKRYDGGWSHIKVFDEKQNKEIDVKWNVKISKQAVIDGLIDILILSKTNFSNSRSTFCQAAWYLKN